MPATVKLDSAVTGQCREYILVPRTPSPGMIEAAWAYALNENAEGVWVSMIEAYEAETSSSHQEAQNLSEEHSPSSETQGTDSSQSTNA